MKDIQEVDVEMLRSWLKEKDVTILDIRDEGSFKEEHIPGAIFLREEDVESFVRRADKDRIIVCYCYHGISSQSAAQFFADHGFQNVFSMIGGFERWRSRV